MRFTRLALLFVLCMSELIAYGQKPLHVMTFNLRYNNPGDSLNSWPYRKDMAASQVQFFDVNIFGVQEALYEQMLDMQQRLPQYAYVGVAETMVKQKVNSVLYFMIQHDCKS